MDKKTKQLSGWLSKEMEKDQLEIQNHKIKMIQEIKNLNKDEIFLPKQKEKVSIITKLLLILGYGKKGDILNQLAMIVDLIEKINADTKSNTIIFELSKMEFNRVFEYFERKNNGRREKPSNTFNITIGNVDVVFNTSSV